LKFFDEYDRAVPQNLFAFTQMTTEVISDHEYLSAMYHKARIRAALIGLESFSEEGLRSANKQWNPTGQRMVEAIQTIQDAGISVLSSIICGLESDTVQTIRTMRTFALQSGSILAQFTFYHPYPGTKDFYEMMNDVKNRRKPNFVPKHATRISQGRFWLKPINEADQIEHANITREDLIAENKACWDAFYSMKEVLRRVRRGRARSWPLVGKFTYVLLCLIFKRIYGGQGMAADGVRQKELGLLTRSLIRVGVATYNHLSRKDRVSVSQPWVG